MQTMRKMIGKYRKAPDIMRASLWFVVCTFLQKGITVITTPIFSRLLSTAEYGQFNVFMSWYSIVEVFVSLEIAKGVYTQSLVKYSLDRAEITSSFQGLNLTLTAAWTLVYLLTKDFWNGLLGITTVQALCMLAMIWATEAFNLWSTDQRVDYRYRALVALTIVTSVMKPLMGIVLVLHADDKVTARIVGLALVEVMAYTGLCVVQLRRGKRFFSKKYWRYALAFAIPLTPHYLAQIVMESSDRIMIRDLVNASAAGIYSMAYSVSMIMRLLNGALNQTIMPWIYKRIKAKETGSIAPVSMVALGLVALANLLLIAFAPEAIAFFAPSDYHEAIWVVPPVAMSVFFLYMYNYFACFEFYFEEKRFIGVASMVAAALNVVLNAVLIPVVGYIAAAYTTLLCNIVYTMTHYLFMRLVARKHLDNIEVYKFRDLVLMSVLMMAFGFVLMLLYNNYLMRYAVIAAAVIVVFGTRKLWKKKINVVFELMNRT